jgi:hypothetical protein
MPPPEECIQTLSDQDFTVNKFHFLSMGDFQGFSRIPRAAAAKILQD